MLKLKDMIENYELTKQILSNWKYDEDTIDQYLDYYRISSNAIYPFTQNGKLCYLRYAPINEKLLSNIKGEIEFILYLNDSNFSALKPIKALNNEYILTINTKWGKYYATAFYGVDGDAMEDIVLTFDICYEYGKTLGKLHKLSSEFKPVNKKQTYEEILSYIEQRLHIYSKDQAIFENLTLLSNKLHDLNNDNNHYGLVHYDYEVDNVFYDDVNNACNVIDFDDGMYHFYAVDIAKAIDSIFDNIESNNHNEYKDAFINGYKSEFYYDDEIETILPLMRKFINIYSYTRILDCLSETVDDEPEWMEMLKDKLNNKADNLLKQFMM